MSGGCSPNCGYCGRCTEAWEGGGQGSHQRPVYRVRVRYHARPDEAIEKSFGSMTARALYIIGVSSVAHIDREWLDVTR